MKKDIVCIICPQSCHLTVEEINGNLLVTGNECKRGERHGIKEYTNPERILTTTIAIKNGTQVRLPVISEDEIRKDLILDCLEVLYDLNVDAPIEFGEVIVNNICNTGINIISSRSMKEKEVN